MTDSASTRLMIIALLGVGLAWAGAVSPALAGRTEEIASGAENYFSAHAANGDFSGQVVIAQHGEIVYEGAFGMANFESDVAVTMDTRFVIASITKTLTAAAILRLAHDGKLDLNDHLTRFVPDYPQADAITPRLLLLFASGIGNPDFDGLRAGPRLTSEGLVRHLAGQPLTFLPGTYSQYSNGNYNVLARVIEATTKSSYGDALSEMLFTPLKMNRTEDGSVAASIDLLASGHTPGPGKYQMIPVAAPRLDLSIGSGALVSTARDLALWGHAVATKRFFDLAALEYPYGWGRTDDHDTNGFEQTGASDGYMSVLRVHPEEGWVISVLANTEYGQWNQWGGQMTRLIYKNEIDIPDPRPAPEELTERELAGAAGLYQKDDRMMEIRATGGHLWLHIDGSPAGKYMSRLGDSKKFDIRADYLEAEIDIPEEGPASTMTLTYPGGSDTYQRTSNAPDTDSNQ
jgi:CubicO group peptidase (beta-lactamase class C family)